MSLTRKGPRRIGHFFVPSPLLSIKTPAGGRMSRIWDMLGLFIARYCWMGRLFIYIELGEERKYGFSSRAYFSDKILMMDVIFLVMEGSEVM